MRQVVDRVNDWIYNKFMQCIKRWTMEAREELKKLRESTGMNRKEFCEYFEIPYMTETDWELGNRRVPQYLLRLMALVKEPVVVSQIFIRFGRMKAGQCLL